MAQRSVLTVGGINGLPSAPSLPSHHNQYGEEAAKAAQRYHEQVAEIERLSRERDEWRSSAQAAEKHIEQLKYDLREVKNTLDQTSDKLIDERDSYKHKLTSLVSQFEMAGSIVLKCMEAARSEAPRQIDLEQLAKDIDPRQPPKEEPEDNNRPIPGFLQKGPSDA